MTESLSNEGRNKTERTRLSRPSGRYLGNGKPGLSLALWNVSELAAYHEGIAGSFVGDSVLPDGNIVRRDLVPGNLTAFVG